MTTRLAIVCPNFVSGHYGGVEAAALWLGAAVGSQPGYQVEVASISTARDDPASVRLLSPRSWLRAPSSFTGSRDEADVEHFGSWVAEWEPARYLPRKSLTTWMNTFDLVQVVSGTPAYGLVGSRTRRPLCLLAATTIVSERAHETLGDVRTVGGLTRSALRATSTAIVRRMEMSAMRRADHTFLMNSSMLAQVSPSIRHKVTLAPPGIDDTYFRPGAGRGDGAYLLSVGRLPADRKNFEGLIRSYGLARATEGLDMPLVIAGGGELPDSLDALVDDLDLRESVHVRENPSPDELLRLYQGATALIHASHEEGLGLVFLEAQACGVPVVSTKTDGAAEVFAQGAVGQLVPCFTGVSAELARAIANWAAQGGTDDVRSRSRAFVEERFGTEVAVARFIDRYEEILR